MSRMQDPMDDDDACDGCQLSQPRRSFLRQVGISAVGALVMVGVPEVLAASFHPTRIRSLRQVDAHPSYPIPTEDGVQIDKENQVILVRWKGAIYAFNLSCPHQNTALRWNGGDSEFQCPKHHSRYQPDGTFIKGRATRNMDRFTLARAGGEIVVNVDQMHKNDADQPGWTASVIHLASGS
ncbi:MAG: Rieske (2Fe-2S) protein [Gemmatimonadota bacterium]